MSLAERHGITPFELFCAYHLGITAEDGYRFHNVHDVAKRFGCSSGVIKQLLGELGMDPDAMVHSSFDLASAQVDIMSAPEGVSRRALAEAIFAEFKRAPRRNRDWARELAVDAVENERTFGPSRAGAGGRSSRDGGTPGGSPAGRGTRRGGRS
jgi:hypothetical protein